MKTEGKENWVARRFDYDAFRQQAISWMLAGDKELGDKDGVLAPLLKDLLDAVLSGELQAHVAQNRPNRCNGSKAKTVKTGHGPISVEMPRDRDDSFEPKLIGKRQTTLGKDWITGFYLCTVRECRMRTFKSIWKTCTGWNSAWAS